MRRVVKAIVRSELSVLEHGSNLRRSPPPESPSTQSLGAAGCAKHTVSSSVERAKLPSKIMPRFVLKFSTYGCSLMAMMVVMVRLLFPGPRLGVRALPVPGFHGELMGNHVV
jgi:hypothetical protein